MRRLRDFREGTGALLVLGFAFDREGCVRIGYANNAGVLREGLKRTGASLKGGRAKAA